MTKRKSGPVEAHTWPPHLSARVASPDEDLSQPRALAARTPHERIDDKPRILILDDDPMIRRALERLAGDRGDLILDAVGTPDELHARIAAHRYDLIVCDYRLDDTRKETSASLVTELATRGLRVAVVTGSSLLIEADLGVPVLEKPVRLEELVTLATSPDGR